MTRILLISQAVIAVLLTVSILLQSRGSGLGSAFGGDFGGYYTKRGFERFLVYATTILAVLFFVLAIVNVRLSIIEA
ncbi:MAG: preprotein translocase subunit SecG [Candidatus Moraniibacteriota bacterium]|nr:MAG: preprotein translocase subunit SecG [Candidatus Moranbacteria bacterium]